MATLQNWLFDEFFQNKRFKMGILINAAHLNLLNKNFQIWKIKIIISHHETNSCLVEEKIKQIPTKNQPSINKNKLF